jgi:hypothetical protein
MKIIQVILMVAIFGIIGCKDQSESPRNERPTHCPVCDSELHYVGPDSGPPGQWWCHTEGCGYKYCDHYGHLYWCDYCKQSHPLPLCVEKPHDGPFYCPVCKQKHPLPHCLPNQDGDLPPPPCTDKPHNFPDD